MVVKKGARAFDHARLFVCFLSFVAQDKHPLNENFGGVLFFSVSEV